MKARRLFPLALPLLLLAAGCDSGDAIATPTCNASGNLTATIDGEAFVADCVSYSFAGGDFTLTGSTTSEGAGARIRREINVVIADVAPGSFTVGADAVATYEEADLDAGTTHRYTGASGEVVVEESSRDNPLGAFSFTAGDGSTTVTVADGQFDVYR